MAQVIDWEEAMQQCGEDEEFLRELLEDLREETKTQMDRMVEIIRVCKALCALQEGSAKCD